MLTLQEFKEIEAKATPAPWDVVCDFIASDNREFSLGSMGDNSWDSSSVLAHGLTEENGPHNKELVSLSRNLLPEFIKVWDALEQAYETLSYRSDGQTHNLLLAFEELREKAKTL